MNGAGLAEQVVQAIEEMKTELGKRFSLEQVNLAELERRTGVSRAKLISLKRNGFVSKEHGLNGRKASTTVLTGYTAVLDDLMKKGVTNSAVCLERLRCAEFSGGLSAMKNYIAAHKDLVPAKR